MEMASRQNQNSEDKKSNQGSTTETELEPLVRQEMEFVNQNLIEQIYVDYGYGWLTWKVILVCAMNLLAAGYSRAFLGVFVIPVKLYFDIDDDALQWIAFSFMIFSSAGMFIYSPIQKFGRWLNISVLSGVLLLSHLALFIDNLWVFIVSRMVLGFASGLVNPIAYNILVECVPAKNRGYILNAIWLGYGLGLTLPLAVMLGTMPNLEPEHLQRTYWALLPIPLVGFLVNLFMLKDSPRNLILQNKYDEAMEILESMKGQPITDYERSIMINQVQSGANKRSSGGSQLIDIATRYKRLTFVMAIITILIYITFAGSFLLMSISLGELQKQQGSTFDGKKNIIEQLSIGLLKEVYVFAGFLTEVKWLGRIGTLQLATTLSFIMIIFFLIFPSVGVVFLGLFCAANNLAYTIFFMFTAEVYPTTVRDLANVIFKSFGAIASASSQLICLQLNKFGVFVPYYFIGVLLFVNIIAVIFVPFETVGVQLDTLIEKKDSAEQKKKEG